MQKFFSLVFGGVAGTLARYVLSGAAYRMFGTNFPYGTLVVNGIGCFVIGFLASVSREKFLLGPEARLLLMVGFCGAFTTFSTLILETDNLLRGGEVFKALGNIFVSVAAGFIVFRAGVFLGELI